VTPRKFGGIGFSIDGLCTELTACPSGPATEPTDREDAAAIDALARTFSGRFGRNAPKITMLSRTPKHVGLGSKTALLLGAATLMAKACGINCSEQDIQILSGRGGASGVGVHAYFKGGVIVDAGHPRDGGPYRPSSCSSPRIIPPLVSQIIFPSQWRISLILASGIHPHGNDEVSFFEQNTPVEGNEVLRVLAAVYHSIIPAFLEADIRLLHVGLAEVCNNGFKRREIANQPLAVAQLLASLANHERIAVGMSSMGPMIYAIHEARDAESANMLRRISHDLSATFVGTFSGRNTGFAE